MVNDNYMAKTTPSIEPGGRNTQLYTRLFFGKRSMEKKVQITLEKERESAINNWRIETSS